MLSAPTLSLERVIRATLLRTEGLGSFPLLEACDDMGQLLELHGHRLSMGHLKTGVVSRVNKQEPVSQSAAFLPAAFLQAGCIEV